MARRRTATVTKKQGVIVVSPPAAAAPVTRRRSGSIRRRKAPRRRRRSSGGASTGGLKHTLIGTAIGGFAYGFIEKTWGTKIPKLPLIGKSGTIAVACYFLAPRSPIIKDVGIAAAAIAGYSFGKTGEVSGDYDEEHGLVQD